MESDVPYVSCWMALDNMSEVNNTLLVITKENGTLYMLPYPKSQSGVTHFPSVKEYQKYHEECASSYESKSFYASRSEQNVEDEIEIPVQGAPSRTLNKCSSCWLSCYHLL